jgi:hypothetical protein
MLNGKILKAFLKDQNWNKYTHSNILFNIRPEALAKTIRKEKEIKGIYVGKE